MDPNRLPSACINLNQSLSICFNYYQPLPTSASPSQPQSISVNVHEFQLDSPTSVSLNELLSAFIMFFETIFSVQSSKFKLLNPAYLRMLDSRNDTNWLNVRNPHLFLLTKNKSQGIKVVLIFLFTISTTFSNEGWIASWHLCKIF